MQTVTSCQIVGNTISISLQILYFLKKKIKKITSLSVRYLSQNNSPENGKKRDRRTCDVPVEQHQIEHLLCLPQQIKM